ncbi:MAG: class I SAM-dependent methyltransferase [Actinomycetota bacterium]|nr:class I SAM-dependent methyltransferase [Actinomycetota bacterium]
MDPESLIQEQIEYYRRRAVEYDETSSPTGDPLAAFGEDIERALYAFEPTGDVLEIASGTGSWTRLLLRHASSVTALDAALEMHQESRRKLGDEPRVRYIEADVLSWEPDRSYDVVFFANWLSHVPPALFDPFWGIVERALFPHGRVFLVDEGKDAWRHEQLRETFVAGESVPVVKRPLQDGTTFHVVKVFWDPHELVERLRGLGWNINVHTVGPFFWAVGDRGG